MGYDETYSKGGFGYNDAFAKQHLATLNLDVEGKEMTLLDVCCGDGFWSEYLEKWYHVTGIDYNKVGVDIARGRCPNSKFIRDDIFKHKFDMKYDVLFCRGVSDLDVDAKGEKFKKTLDHLLNLCSERLVYIQSTNLPYNEYNGYTYNIHPDEVDEVFKSYGFGSSASMVQGYLVGNIYLSEESYQFWNEVESDE